MTFEARFDLGMLMSRVIVRDQMQVQIRHRRFHLHFVPTSSSWLNLVERWFRDLTEKRIRRGVFPSVGELIAAIQAYIQHHNSHPKPFVWTAKAEDIIAKYHRAKAVLDKVQTGETLH